MATNSVDRRRAGYVAGVALALLLIGLIAALVSLERSFDRVEVEGLGGPSQGDRGPDGREPDGLDGRDGGGERDRSDGTEETIADLPPPDALTILLLGSDSREVLTPEERRELGTGDFGGERTESIALLRLDPEADTLRMLNVPRDTLLTRCDDSRGRVNAAYSIGERESIGGLSCVVQTLTAWTGVTIDHAVLVDFRGFVDIVDAVGGVPITLDEPIQDARANLDLPSGCTRLDGAQALAFVRARSIDSDFGRIERQQRFVEELRMEVRELGILRDLPQLYRTVRAVARAAELDRGLSLRRIQQLARKHRTTLEAPIDGRSIPGRTEWIDGIAFLRVDDEDMEEAVDWFEGASAPDTRGHDAASGEDDEPAAGTRPPDDEDVPERC